MKRVFLPICCSLLITGSVAAQTPVLDPRTATDDGFSWAADPALTAAVARGIRSLLVARRCVREDGCLDLPDRPVRVRSRESVTSPILRKPDLLPPSEIRTAVLRLVEAAHGVGRQELPTAVARLLGFKTTPTALRTRVDTQVARLESEGRLTPQGNLLILADPGSTS